MLIPSWNNLKYINIKEELIMACKGKGSRSGSKKGSKKGKGGCKSK